VTKEVILAQEQEDFEEGLKDQKSREAATLVFKGASRSSAVSTINDIYAAQADASPNEFFYDDNGHPEYFGDGMQLPTVDETLGKPGQLNVIARELRDTYFP